MSKRRPTETPVGWARARSRKWAMDWVLGRRVAPRVLQQPGPDPGDLRRELGRWSGRSLDR